jgi:hypothetical protein
MAALILDMISSLGLFGIWFLGLTFRKYLESVMYSFRQAGAMNIPGLQDHVFNGNVVGDSMTQDDSPVDAQDRGSAVLFVVKSFDEIIHQVSFGEQAVE